jgi:hypothetical protein
MVVIQMKIENLIMGLLILENQIILIQGTERVILLDKILMGLQIKEGIQVPNKRVIQILTEVTLVHKKEVVLVQNQGTILQKVVEQNLIEVVAHLRETGKVALKVVDALVEEDKT